jgi:GAF domain-containing protein
MMVGVTRSIPRWLSAVLMGVALIAGVSAVIALLDPSVSPLALGVLYLFAVVPVAMRHGMAAAAAVSVTSMATFAFLFLAPRYHLSTGTREHAEVLVAFLVSSLVVSQLAARAQREARRSARLADEQAALKRVATLVARGVPPSEVFAAVAREVGLLLGVDATHMARYERDGTASGVAAWNPAGDEMPVGTRVDLEGESVAGLVSRTQRPARMQDYEHASGEGAALGRALGLRAAVGAPIVVDQQPWGVLIASSRAEGGLPADAEARIAAFTELVATAISNTETRVQLARLADEQAALRRVATLVARGASSDELFAAVVEEVCRVLPVALVSMARYESDGTIMTAAISSGVSDRFAVGSRWPLGGDNVSTMVYETGRPARMDSYEHGSGELTAAIRDQNMLRSSVGTPIVVEGHLWGVMTASSSPEKALPADTEARLAAFTELVATAISNADARTELRRLADEQAALRRVATLVARAVPQDELFATATEEIGSVLGADLAMLCRYETDDTVTVMAGWSAAGEHSVVGRRWPVQEGDLATEVLRSGRAARWDGQDGVPAHIAAVHEQLGIRSSVAGPILVEGRPWGGLVVHSKQAEPLPQDTPARLENFTDLVATAILNAEGRAEVAASRARIVAATDQERRRVTRDLHDGAQQQLINTVITLKLAQRALQTADEDVPALLTAALDNAEQANIELRELSQGILPAALTSGGLSAGVQALASRMPVPVEIDVSVGRLPIAVEATAYFVVAEALTNVAKHARAGHAEVTAHIEGSALAVRVRDDGVGGAGRGGSGLIGLADRLAALDGEFRFESPVDGGTLVAAAIPLPV